MAEIYFYQRPDLINKQNLEGKQEAKRFLVVFGYDRIEPVDEIKDFFKTDNKFNLDSEKLYNIVKEIKKRGEFV